MEKNIPMSETIRPRMAQALTRVVSMRMTEIHGENVPLFGGVWAIFAAEQWLAGKMSDDEAIADMVARFEQLTEAWLAARGRKAA